MKVAGLGFRQDVTLASLREALMEAGGVEGLAAVATVSDKADAEALKQLARECGVPIKAVSAEALANIHTPTQSKLVAEKFGTGSFPLAATHSTSSNGAPRFLASCTSSSLPRIVRCFISLTMVRI